MVKIYESKNFVVKSFEQPHIDREDGGHLGIYPKKEICDRTEMNSQLAIEFIRLTMIIGKSLKIGMTNKGIEIMRVNYQDMGNWAFKKNKKPFFHLHIYGRAKNAKYQPYKEAVRLPDRSTGFYDKFDPLNEGDVIELKKQIELVLKEENYRDIVWGL